MSSLLESIFLTVNEWMVSGTAIAAVGCLAWGMISVLFSPCHLASIPLIVAYVGGQEQALNPKQAGVYSSSFTLGLFISIALIGNIFTGTEVANNFAGIVMKDCVVPGNHFFSAMFRYNRIFKYNQLI